MLKRGTAWAGYTRVFLLLLLACCSGLAFSHEAAANDSVQPVLRIAIGRTPPVGESKFSGYLEPVLKELFKRAGLSYELVGTPAGRVHDEANAGNSDAAISPLQNANSRFSGLVSLPGSIIPIELAGLYTRDDIELSSVEDFFDYRLAYVRGLRPAERLFGRRANVVLARSPSMLMSMLKHDRVDVVFHSAYLGRFLAEGIGLEDVKVSDFFITVQVYLHLNRRHARLLPVLDTQLRAMKADGSLDAILVEHGVR